MKMASMWWTQDNASEPVKTNNELEDLFVFGYACKTFRDDDKASYIDRGKHLIPWMGDERLLIDRYDGRGHLYDLSAYDAANVQSENIELSDTEKAVEAACDEERYLELRTDIAEAELYQEEEWKRYYQSLHDGYKAVGFSYEQPTDDYAGASGQQNSAAEAEEDKPFVVPTELQVPKGVDLPATKKENAIIEKTAKFIAEHGAQMEIIIKTKQSGNPQFDFMHFEDKLNFYYRHMVKMIKSGKYKPAAPEVNQDDSYEDDDNQHNEHGYLHPLLNANTSTTQPSKPIKMPAVSIHNTSYGQLIKSIKKSSAKASENGSSTSQSGSRNTPPLAPPPLPPFVTQPIYGSAHPGLPPPPGTEPVVLPHMEFPPFTQGSELTAAFKEEEEGGGRSTPSQIVPPPPDSQPIIDRMAMYVAKNGVEFEIVVKSKNDQRFQFLHPWHVHFPYYDFKKQIFLKEVEQERLEKEEAAAAAANKSVSFSIKTRTKEPENNVTQLKKPLFDYGSSDDDNEGESDSQKERTTEFTSSSPAASESGQGSEVSLEVKQEVRTDIPVDALEKKMAEERLKDRLANAAREKLAQASKEKQVQAERKRKAAMFINLLKNKPTSTDESSRDGPQESYSSMSPRGTPSNSRSSTPGVCSSQERSIPRDERESYAEHDRYDSYRRGWPIRSRSRSPHLNYRSRSRSPRARHRSRSKSPIYQWRRRRSPTPPSAFSSMRRSRSRSPSRRSPPTRINIGRRRSRSRSPRRAIPVPSRSRPRSRSPKPSRSPARKRSKSHDRKRKSKSPSKSKKRSRSKSPSSKHKKSKKSETRSPKKKKKDKEKEKSKDKRKDKVKEKTKDKDREKPKDKEKSQKPSQEPEGASKTEVKITEDSKETVSEPENDNKSDTRHSSSDSDGEATRASEPGSKVRSSHESESGTKIRRISQDSESESKIEVIMIDDNDDVDDVVPQPPGPPPSLPPLPPLPPEEEKTQSPRLLPDCDLRESNSGLGSPALDADGKPTREVSKHLLSRVRALLKASRDEVLKEEGLDDP